MCIPEALCVSERVSQWELLCPSHRRLQLTQTATVKKVSDGSAVVGGISDGDEAEDRAVVSSGA